MLSMSRPAARRTRFRWAWPLGFMSDPGGLRCGRVMYGVHDSVLSPYGVADRQAPMSAGRLQCGRPHQVAQKVWNMSTRIK